MGWPWPLPEVSRGWRWEEEGIRYLQTGPIDEGKGKGRLIPLVSEDLSIGMLKVMVRRGCHLICTCFVPGIECSSQSLTIWYGLSRKG